MNKHLLLFLAFTGLIVGCAALFLPLTPYAFATALNKQYELDLERQALEKELKAAVQLPDSQERDERTRTLSLTLEQVKHELLLYKHDWGNSLFSAIRTYYKNGTIACGNALIPFCMILYCALFFLMVALTPGISFPLSVRVISFITGNIFAVIALTQWIIAALVVPAWYTKITSIIFSIIGISALLFCWKYLLQKFFNAIIEIKR